MKFPIHTELQKRALELELSWDELSRYSRQMLLPDLGLMGQKRLKAGRVLIIGVGGLGCPASLYLGAAGVGTIGLCEFDEIDRSNLHRQILYGEQDIGTPKIQAAARQLKVLNPNLHVIEHPYKIDETSVEELISQYDVVLDGTDNLPSRYLIADACALTQTPLVYGAIFRFSGQASVFYSPWGPCYRCLFPSPPAALGVPACSEGGVLGAVAGQIGLIQALEVLKLLGGIGDPLIGRVLTFDGRSAQYSEFRLERDPSCVLCGASPLIRKPLLMTPEISFQDCRHGKLAHFIMRPSELEELCNAGVKVKLWDIRSKEEFVVGTIPNSELIDRQFLLEALKDIPQEVKVILFCTSGIRSASTLQVCLDSGFTNVFSLEGGIEAWKAQNGKK